MSKNAKRRWREISERKQREIYAQTEEIKDASEQLYEFVQGYIENHKISCPESIHQSDEINLDAPHFMEKCCEIVGLFHEKENS